MREEKGRSGNESNGNARGHQRLVVWRNAYSLRRRVYDITKRFPHGEIRRISQMRDAARSVKQNIQEGYARGSLGEYRQALVVSRGSLAELAGDVQDCFDDGLITGMECRELDELIGKTNYLFQRLLTSLRDEGIVKRWRKFPSKER